VELVPSEERPASLGQPARDPPRPPAARNSSSAKLVCAPPPLDAAPAIARARSAGAPPPPPAGAGPPNPARRARAGTARVRRRSGGSPASAEAPAPCGLGSSEGCSLGNSSPPRGHAPRPWLTLAVVAPAPPRPRAPAPPLPLRRPPPRWQAGLATWWGHAHGSDASIDVAGPPQLAGVLLLLSAAGASLGALFAALRERAAELRAARGAEGFAYKYPVRDWGQLSKRLDAAA
jgi:hypothetical protein